MSLRYMLVDEEVDAGPAGDSTNFHGQGLGELYLVQLNFVTQ